jgi:hypothetical protein
VRVDGAREDGDGLRVEEDEAVGERDGGGRHGGRGHGGVRLEAVGTKHSRGGERCR